MSRELYDQTFTQTCATSSSTLTLALGSCTQGSVNNGGNSIQLVSYAGTSAAVAAYSDPGCVSQVGPLTMVTPSTSCAVAPNGLVTSTVTLSNGCSDGCATCSNGACTACRTGFYASGTTCTGT